MNEDNQGLESKQYQDAGPDSVKIEALFKKLLELPPPKKPSVIAQIESHRRLLNRLITHGYSYKQISELLAKEGIKASPQAIAQVAKGRNKSSKRVAQEGGESA